MTDRTKPLYMIGVVAEMLKVHPQTLRFYEKKGLVRPGRTEGQTRMYSDEDLEEVARLLRLTRDLGVNLAGVEIINDGALSPSGGRGVRLKGVRMRTDIGRRNPSMSPGPRAA